MRTRFVITILLLALALGFLPAVHGAMDAKKDDVTIYETALWGDSSAASGLAVKAATHMDQRLFWETTFRPGSDTLAETEFTYYPERRAERYDYDNTQLTVSFAESNYGISGAFTMEELEDEEEVAEIWHGAMDSLGKLWAPMVDVARRTPAGETYTEDVRVADYYEYYPMRVNLYFDSSHMNEYIYFNETKKANDLLTKFFAVEIPEAAMLNVTIRKDSYGTVQEIDCRYSDSIENEELGYLYGQELGIHTALTVDGGYMVLSREKKDPTNSYETVLDSPRLKEDYGIYFFPLVEYLPENVVSMDGRNPERVADMEQLGNVFPLGDEVNAVNLYYYREADQLILVTEEAGHIWATIIDRKSMTELQKIDLGSIGEQEYVDNVLVQGDLLLVSVMELYSEEKPQRENRLVMLKQNAGSWVVELQTPISWPDQGRYVQFDPYWQAKFLWNGERLAIAQFENYRSSCDVYVLICAEDELKYVGKYQRRDTNGGVYDYNRMIQPVNDGQGLEIFWE